MLINPEQFYGYWDFETSQYDLTQQRGATPSGTLTYTASSEGTALTVSRAGLLDCGNVNIASATQWTIMALVSTDGTGTDEHTICSNWDNAVTSAGMLLRTDPSASNQIEGFAIREANTQIGGNFTDLTLTSNKFHMVSIRYDADDIKVLNAFLDYKKSATTFSITAGMDATTPANNFYIGYSPHSGTDGFSGKIKLVMFFRRALRDDEIYDRVTDPYMDQLRFLNPPRVSIPSSSINITIPQGDLTFSTSAPTLAQTDHISISVPQGDLTFSTAAPILALSDNIGITIPQADLTFSTTAPTINVTAGVNITIPQADLALSTAAPTVNQTANVSITIPQADLVLSTTAPTAVASENIAIEIPGGNLSLSTTAPLLDFGLTIPQADLTFSTTAPSVVQTANVSITVPQADLSFSTTAPSLVVTGAGINISIPAADLAFSTFAPILDFGYTIPQANLTFTGSAPSLGFGLTIPQANLVLDPKTPSFEIKTAWYDVSDETTTWSDVADGSTVWTDVTDVSTTWSN